MQKITKCVGSVVRLVKKYPPPLVGLLLVTRSVEGT